MLSQMQEFLLSRGWIILHCIFFIHSSTDGRLGYFFFKHLYWSIIALQWCVSFCFITKWISYTYTYVPISLPSCLVYFYILTIVNNATVKWECKYLFDILFLFLLDIYSEVGLLDHVVVPFLIFWGDSILFSIVAASI